MNKKSFYSLLVIGLLVLGILIVGSKKDGKCASKTEQPRESTPQLEPKSELMNTIKIKAEGEILHFQKESLWSEKAFPEILRSRKEFESKEIHSFTKDLERFNRYAVNPKVKFNEPKKSTTLICDIKGAKQGSWFDFDWFLRPWGLDFIDSHFEKREKELYWQGKVEGAKTIISIRFPYSISNCHEHVWPR
jgi:hypothetical protein